MAAKPGALRVGRTVRWPTLKAPSWRNRHSVGMPRRSSSDTLSKASTSTRSGRTDDCRAAAGGAGCAAPGEDAANVTATNSARSRGRIDQPSCWGVFYREGGGFRPPRGAIDPHARPVPPEAVVRICSLLPSATEIVFALGLGDHLVAVTHECDEPPAARTKPPITSSAIDPHTLTSAQIDALVTRHRHDHRGLYRIDRDLLARLDPDLILTQELCDVCAVAYADVQAACRQAGMDGRRILSLEPAGLAGVLDSIVAVGRATGTEARAQAIVAALQARIAAVRARVAGAPRPRVACVEWLDPPFSGGHWVPEMVAAAGGEDVLAGPGERSRRLTWAEVAAARPEVVVLMPCGFGVERAVTEYRRVVLPPAWAAVPAVRAGRVWAVDANGYFSRPGPRLVDGLEMLAAILHPARYPGDLDPARARRV
jgi:iron complex transport system substrate-binding protein